MFKLSKIAGFVLMLVAQYASSAEEEDDVPLEPSWSEMPIMLAEEREDVRMGDYSAFHTNVGNQNIYLDEEIKDDVPIAKLNYNGIENPYIEPRFQVGTFADLGPQIRRHGVGGPWYLYVTVRQDYESKKTWYVFRVRVPNEPFVAQVSLEIVNIDERALMRHNLKTGRVRADIVDAVAEKGIIVQKPYYVQFLMAVIIVHIIIFTMVISSVLKRHSQRYAISNVQATQNERLQCL